MTANLALTQPDPTLDEMSLRVMMAAADRYVKSGLLPTAIKTPQQALIIMKMGRELGVPDTYALRNIHVINGKPVASAELLMALVRRAYGVGAIRVAEASSQGCMVEYREHGWDGVSSLSWTLEEAKQAKLLDRDVWKAYPRAMLRSRAVSEVVRMAFPECIAGLYTVEEMGGEVTVNAEGEVIPVDSAGASIRDVTVSYGGSEPTAEEIDAAHAMVRQSPDVVAGLREKAIGRCYELARYAELTDDKMASKILAKLPENLSDERLREWVEWLEARYPGVTSEDVAALDADGSF